MKKLYFALTLMLLSFGVYAQSADVITQIIETDKVTYGQVCYLSAVRQNLISDDDSFDAAMQVISDKFQLERLLGTDSKADVQTVASLYLKIWPEQQGSLFYSLTGSPRYAFKYLKALGIIPESYDPHSTLSGTQALNLLTSCMNAFGTEEECMTMDIE